MSAKSISRREFVQISAAGLLAAALPGIAPASQEGRAWEKRLRLASGPSLRVLQFTDVHFFNGIHKLTAGEEEALRQRSRDDMRRLVDHAKPDLLFVTGDLWHEDPDGRGPEFMAYAIEQCAALGVPWAFTWGNHDRLRDESVGHTAFSAAKGSLYAGGENDGNYVVTVEEGTGAPVVQFFCLNTKREGAGTETREFIKQAAAADDGARRPMRVAACHIPLQQYRQAWESRSAAGIIGEVVCSEKEDGTTLSMLRDARIQAIFCGHDHVNDFSGRKAGVVMIYGRATGHAGYGQEKVPKGAKLYSLDPARKAMEWLSLLPDGTSWKPAPGERIEKWD